jgi:pilus assembly protein CpaB
MNRYRMLIGLGIALVVALFASTYVYRQLQRQPVVTKQVPTTQVVVAAENLPLGTRLGPQQLRLIPWAGNAPMSGMFTRIEDCTGRALIQSVVANEPILEANLAPKEAGAGLSATIPEGMRALSVAVNDVIGVAGFVLPGTTVDVLATASVGSENITKTILENIRVLAAGQKITQDKEGKPQTVSVVTLLVTPEDADKLTMASTQGRIQLALRNTIDTKKVNPAPVVLNSLFLGGGLPIGTGKKHYAPRKPEPEPYVVEVISGSKRETKTFKNP